MATAEYQEDIVSLIPALRLLMNLGYSYLSPSEGQELRGGRLSQAVLDRVLRQQLSRINSFMFKGKSRTFSQSNISKAVQEMTAIPFDSLVTTNEQVYDLLTLGKSFEQTIQGYTRSFTLRYVDFADPSNNVFHVSDEFVVERRHSHQTRRPDIVLFVNGIPLSVVECKRPDKPDAVLEGVSQHLRNQLSDEIPHLFVYSQLLLSVCQNAALHGTTGTPRRFWGIWKEDYGSQEARHLHTLVNRSLPDDQLEKMFAGRDDWQTREMERQWLQGPRVVLLQDKAIYSLLRPERLLEITERFVVFDNSVKKVPRYQQYFAVKRTMERV
ncbi:MAG: type I restriction endonuclease subunit R, partial [Spirochaetaceae bacterium]|nr:type I restriction endonuclease subunit R [Spirochaetaceae bacterium]